MRPVTLSLLLICGFLPELAAQDVPPPNPEAVAAIKALGGNVMPIAQNDAHLDVTLHLASGDVTDDALAQVAKLDGIVWLNLAGTKVTDAGLAQLANLKSLEKLHLERTSIGDEGLTHLAGLEKLAYLNLYGTKVTDAGLKQLHNLKQLRRVYVWQTGVTDAGMAELKAAIPEVTIIAGLDLKPVEPPKPEEPKKEGN